VGLADILVFQGTQGSLVIQVLVVSQAIPASQVTPEIVELAATQDSLETQVFQDTQEILERQAIQDSVDIPVTPAYLATLEILE
jgi:hypothetical protein